MKKKIVFGLAIFALMFFAGGVYIVTTTQTTFYELHRLSQLHRTVALRKDLLLSIKKNQNSIILRNRQFAMEVASGEQSMTAIMEKCFACHFDYPFKEKIVHLKSQIEGYDSLTRAVFAAGPGSAPIGKSNRRRPDHGE